MTSHARAAPRPLSEREAATLRRMLSPDDVRLDPLRDQAAVATVVGRCDCGCATIDLAVDRDRARAALGLCSPVVETRTRLPHGEAPYELLLFLDGGWLASLEIVYYTGDAPVVFPPPGEFEPPEVRC